MRIRLVYVGTTPEWFWRVAKLNFGGFVMLHKTCASMLSILSLAIMVLASLVSPARATVLIVPDGFATIQDAVDSAAPNDTVLVRNGVYREGVIARRRLTLMGEGRTVIDGFVNFESDRYRPSWLQGIALRGSLLTLGGLQVIDCVLNASVEVGDEAMLSLIESELHLTSGQGISVGAGASLYLTDTTVEAMEPMDVLVANYGGHVALVNADVSGPIDTAILVLNQGWIEVFEPNEPEQVNRFKGVKVPYRIECGKAVFNGGTLVQTSCD